MECIFGCSLGGLVKVFVLGSGLMGLLFGSVVVNVMIIGVFMILMMRNVGFDWLVVGGIMVVVVLGGVFVLFVMGVGVYMMLELVEF